MVSPLLEQARRREDLDVREALVDDSQRLPIIRGNGKVAVNRQGQSLSLSVVKFHGKGNKGGSLGISVDSEHL